ncbi:MAG: serine/threonine protein kinase, partial [Thiolinea sp.]
MTLPTIPDYALKEIISQNQSATIYRAIHAPLAREVALKVLISPPDAPYDHTVKRFLSEARISANLEHNHIINIYDTGRQGDLCFFSMEYLRPGSLRQKLNQEQPFSTQWITGIILQLASALSYTHNRGYIHRDIKPENILFRDEDHVVLSDFGIAKRSNKDTATQSRLLLGSPHYMAPEQALDHHADARSDMYSLGIIFYELLTRSKTYDDNKNYLENIHAIQQLPKQLAKHHQHFRPLLEKLLAREPRQRFQNIDVFIESLQALKPHHKDDYQDTVKYKSAKLPKLLAATALLFFL